MHFQRLSQDADSEIKVNAPALQGPGHIISFLFEITLQPGNKPVFYYHPKPSTNSL